MEDKMRPSISEGFLEVTSESKAEYAQEVNLFLLSL